MAISFSAISTCQNSRKNSFQGTIKWEKLSLRPSVLEDGERSLYLFIELHVYFIPFNHTTTL